MVANRDGGERSCCGARGAGLELDLGPMQAAAREADTAIPFDFYTPHGAAAHWHVVCGPRSLPSRTILFDPFMRWEKELS
jgi:hypothetical protein